MIQQVRNDSVCLAPPLQHDGHLRQHESRKNLSYDRQPRLTNRQHGRIVTRELPSFVSREHFLAIDALPVNTEGRVCSWQK